MNIRLIVTHLGFIVSKIIVTVHVLLVCMSLWGIGIGCRGVFNISLIGVVLVKSFELWLKCGLTNKKQLDREQWKRKNNKTRKFNKN